MNRTFRILATLVTLAMSCVAPSTSAAQNLIPKPVNALWGEGVVALTAERAVEVTHLELAPLADLLLAVLPSGRVRLAYAGAEDLPAGGYRLSVAPDLITVAGRDYGGVWNGTQTLLQLFPPDIYRGADALPAGITLPVVEIEDWPAMEHRGVMLDVARTFVPKEQVMQLIENIARHKINKFHWHLADDEGWRIEIKSYPRLTDIGAWRGGDSPLFPVYGAWDRKYGGFYTQDEIREVVAFAALRGVEVIPEIDLPGHSRAAAIAHPEILCGYTPDLTSSGGYDTRNVWCVAREENYAMLDAVIGEVASLFPSPMFHLGGDEVETGSWRSCPHCKALMAQRGITDAARLQDIFMDRVIEIAARHGKDAAVWNEAANSGKIPKTTTVWSWENPARASRTYAAAGYPTVVCAGEYFYFDMRQSARDIGHIWAGVVTLEKVYSFSLAALGFTAAEQANVRGVQATLFHELGLEYGPGYVDYQLFPRVCALAEVGWTPAEGRSWDEFNGRLTGIPSDPGIPVAPSHLDRLTAMGIAYRRAEPEPDTTPLKTPAVTFTSSLTARDNEPFSRVSAYSGAARTTRSVNDGDWMLWTFAQPLTASRIDIKTGYDHLQRGGVPTGRVEVSHDGTTFQTATRMHDLRATLTPDRPIKAIRIVSESPYNGETFTIVQPLKIR